MARDLTSAVSLAIAGAKTRPVVFYEGEFDASGGGADYLRLWSGIGSYSWDAKTWIGAGELLGISRIEEASEIRAVGFEVSLTAEASAILALNLGYARQGRPGNVWIGFLERLSYLLLPGIAGNYASTPDSSALDITGDLQIITRFSLDDWTPTGINTLVSKRAGSNFSYQFRVQTSGMLELVWTEDGSTAKTATSTTGPVVADGAVLTTKVTLDVDNGAAGKDVKFWTSTNFDPATGTGTWSQLGATVTTAGTTSIFSGNAALEVGRAGAAAGQLAAGKAYFAEVRNGIDGTVVARFDPSQNLALPMQSGELWTINTSGATIAQVLHLDDQLIADPFLAFSGRFDVPEIADQGAQATIIAKYESRLIDLDRPRLRRYTDQDQKIDYPTDKGFEYVAALQQKDLAWGRW